MWRALAAAIPKKIKKINIYTIYLKYIHIRTYMPIWSNIYYGGKLIGLMG
jgi:hypothetical protein